MNQTQNKQPLVSVVMPVYNAAPFLRMAIESVLQQTFQDFELICVDDGSYDGSWEILEEYAALDVRIRIYKNPQNTGIGYTRKRLIDLSHGKFAAIMDADDIMMSDRLAKQVMYMQAHPEVIVLGGQCITIDEFNNLVGIKTFPTDHESIYKMMYTRMSMQQPSTMINLALVPKDFPWYDNSVSPVEDLDNLFRLFNYGKFVNLNEPVLKYRVYNSSNSLKNPKRTFWLTMKVRRRAVRDYNYKPTLAAQLTVFAQMIVVGLMPAKWIVPLYVWMRGIKRQIGAKDQETQIALAWQKAYNHVE